MTHWLDEFERCAPWIRAALATTVVPTHSIGDVFALIAKGEAQLHAGRGCCFVTIIEKWANGNKVLNVWMGGGDLAEMTEMAPMIDRWAQEVGCTHALIRGRPGWQRMSFLKDLGFALDAVTLAKEYGHDSAMAAARAA